MNKHEELKIYVREFTEALKGFKSNSKETKSIIDAIITSDSFNTLVRLSQKEVQTIDDDGELDTEVKFDKPEWEVNDER